MMGSCMTKKPSGRSERRARSASAPRPLALLVAVLVASPFAAQEAELTVDQVLQKHVEARGGLEAISALDNLVMTGIISAQGFELTLTVRQKRPNLVRNEVAMPGMEILQVFDGKAGWGQDPMSGVTKPAPMPPGESAAIARQASFDGALIDPRKARAKVELVGKAPLDGRDAYELQITHADGATETVFLDAESFLERRRETTAVQSGSPIELTVVTTEYADVAGVKYPSAQSVLTPMGDMEYRFTAFEPHSEIDPELFLLPGQKADATLGLEQVLERYRAARSAGASEISTLRAKGKLGMMGLQLPLEMTFARPRSARLQADMPGMQLILAYDGETAWTLSPMQGIPEPEALPAEAGEAIALFADFLWGLLGEGEVEGWQISLEGIDQVDRDETYKLKLDRGDGEVRYLFLGGESFLERKIHLSAVFMGSQQMIDALLSDYRRAGGVMVPHQITLLTGGTQAATVAIDAVEANVELAPDHFSLPPPKPPTPDAPAAPPAARE
jgi:outer membrane lipoprotein-sorting protein